MPGTYSKLVTVISGQTITASERNNEFDNVINNMTPDGVDDASANAAAMQATTDPAGASLATDLRGEIKRLRFQLLKLGAASGNWYDALPFLAGITPAAAGATGTDLNNRLAQIASQLKNLSGATNWYDVLTAALLKTGGTMSGAIAMGTSKITGLGAATTNGDALRYEQLVGVYLLLTGGTMAGAIAMGTSKITGLGNGTAAQDAAAFGQIKVLQFVQNTSSTATTSSSSTFTAVTNHTVVITPTSASNRVKVSVSVPVAVSNSATQGSITLKRGATELSGVTQGFAVADYATSGALGTLSFSFIDSPATTSATTYALFVRSSNNASNVTAGRTDVASVLIAEEIV